MSKSSEQSPRRAVALQYGPGQSAPVIVASGMGNMAEKIVEVATDSGVPVYEDNSLATVLSQMSWGVKFQRNCTKPSWRYMCIF